jgi:transcriptional regulator GlxA family with amidase domain
MAYVTASEFERDTDYIPDRITRDGTVERAWPVEPGRYRLFLPRACPWANRAIIVRRLDLRSHRALVDTLVVVGGPVAGDAARDPDLVRGVRRTAKRAPRGRHLHRRVILADCGLLDGHRATTHWNYGEILAARHPAVEVDTEPIFVHDGRVWTSAGVTSGYDLVLALVEADAGLEVARQCAQLLVLYLRRPGTQSQFSAALSAQLAQRQPLQEIHAYIHEHPAADLSLTALADQLHMSARHFARVFTAEVGVSPAEYRRRFGSTDSPHLSLAV